MRKNNILKRLLSVFLVLCLIAAWIPAASARETGIKFTQVSNDRVSANLLGKDAAQLSGNQPEYAPTDIVRVSIFLDKAGVIDAGYPVMGLAQNAAAMAYRDTLAQEQTSVINRIETVTQEKLDVVWNLTLATNLISANVQYGQIEAISGVRGVKNVVIETQYQPDVASSAAADPNMATSGVQTGTAGSYSAGYTGAGSRVAIIDTGLDIDHQSFNASAYEYSLSLLAEKAGLSVEEYTASLDLLDAEEIAAVLSELNVMDRISISAEDMYISTKIPFGFNYVDGNNNVTHLYDAQGEHGSHVAGIATANAYIPNEDGSFSSALEKVFVQGVAPDAQVIVMKVFGANGGAYQADYMAAIEDAILLGADAINLSLGSGSPGMSSDSNAQYRAIFDNLEKSGVVVSISAGNSGSWVEAAENGLPYLYLDDVSMHASGSPGTYTNSLGVASVDNAGFVATYVTVDGQIISYTEMLTGSDGTVYGNAPLTSLAGDQEFVFLNGIGTEEQFDALGEEVLKGKIALCYRGETSFFEKANAAVKNGAIGVMIVNNQDGLIYLDLTGYLYNAPVVALTQVDGEAFKINAVTAEDGSTLYWTGTMNVAESSEAFLYNNAYYTMSSFSSWGVPGSLIMKPEITAPGGAILSVAGAYRGGVADHVSYELMSGTSMAAPQVAGMAALVAQYIRENNLTELTGLDARTLAQSLLMSTAVPILDGESGGNYYPILQQGAGLANVGAAIAADSYILMNADATNSYADGKVKVELGDDPAREGVYTFSFSINNLTDSEKAYALSADFFTQSAFSYSGILLMDTWTENLYPMVVFTVDGKEIEGGQAMFGMDFNGDGYVNSADGQILLDYATGAVDAITNEANADLDSNGSVTSYDAYLFFQMLGQSGVVVAANGSATVEVTVTLSESDREWLAYYENGAYLQGFVYAEGIVDEEGVEGTSHSIPVLGFYGNWSDPSMFDKGSYEEFYLTGEEYRPPYLYNSAYYSGNMNGLFITYGDDPTNEYYFGGNPIIADEVYMPERNAISAVNGDMISTIGFTSIRNAGASVYQVLDLTNGKALIQESVGPVTSAYYSVNEGFWRNTYLTLNANLLPDFVDENTLLEVGFTLIPEYYVDENGYVDLEALGDGVTLSMNMTVDNTAPVLNNVSLGFMTNTLDITVTDNQYIAAVALLDQYGEYVYVLEGSQAEALTGQACQYALDLTEVAGTGFLLQVYDYAMNCTTYEIDAQIGEVVDYAESIVISNDSLIMQKGSTEQLSAVVYPVNASNRDVVWSSSNEEVAAVDENGNVLAVSAGIAEIIATSKLDETVTASCTVEVIDIAVDLNAIIWDEVGSIWYSSFNTATLPDYTKLSGDLLDIDYLASACVAPDGTIYASSLNTNSGTGSLYTIDPVTYEVTKLTDCLVQGLHIFYSDMAYAPNLYGAGMDALLVTYGPYVIALDATTGAYIEILDQYDGDLIGISVCYGMYFEDYQQSEVAVYVMQSNGTLYQEIYCHLPSFGMTLPYYYYMYGFRVSLDTGISKGDAWYYNSLHYDADRGMLFWSAFNVKSDSSVTLYAIDEMNDFAIYNMGQFPEDVWPVGGLHQGTAPITSETDSHEFHNILDALANKPIEPKTYVIERVHVVKEDIRNQAQPLGNVAVGEKEDSVTVEITAKELTTNGVVTVTFNSAALTLSSVKVNGDYVSVNKADGSVTFGFVQLDGFAADDVVATLVFDVLDTTAADITVTYKELNDTTPNTSEDVEVEFPHANTELRDYKAPTCTEDGYTGDTYCLDCGILVSAGEVIPATGHSHEVTDSKEATCTEDGFVTYTCHCGDTYTEVVKATGHDYEAVVTEPTCTEAGYTTYTCHCGDSYVTNYVSALGHTYEAVVTEPTCTEAGYTTYTCHCGDTYVANYVSALGHSHEVTDSKEATCTEDGFVTYTCRCGDTYTEVVEATGHNHVINDSKEATCTEDGYVTYTCDCGDTYTEVVEATGHSYVDGVCEHCGEGDAINPPTGTFNVLGMALVAMMSVTAVVCITGKKKE